MQDIRYARSLLDRIDNPDMQQDERVASNQIDAAIGEIKYAAYHDRKNRGDHPPIDPHLQYADRFHRAIESLKQARRDCEHEEDNPAVRGLQARAIEHVDDAIRASRHAVGDALQ